MQKRNYRPTDTERGWLDALEVMARETARYEEQIRGQVALLRSHGVTWQYIGDALGISKQGAQKRFG